MPFEYCKKCKKWLNSKIKFCPICGFAQGKNIPKRYDDRTSIVYILCPCCFTKVDRQSKFCGCCGKNIKQEILRKIIT